MTDCPVIRCNRPTNPGWAICRACGADLEQALAETPGLAEHLDATMARQTGTHPGDGSRSAEKPMPYDLRAAEATWILRSTLTGWIRDLNTNTERPRTDNLAAMARWLTRRLTGLCIHPAAEQAVEELTAAVRHGWNVVDNPPDRVFLGPCPTCQAEDVHATVGATQATCRGCGTTHDVETLRTALRASLDDHLVTGPEFAGLAIAHLGAHIARERLEGRVHTWAARGLITSTGHVPRNGAAMPTYRFADLRDRLDRGNR